MRQKKNMALYKVLYKMNSREPTAITESQMRSQRRTHFLLISRFAGALLENRLERWHFSALGCDITLCANTWAPTHPFRVYIYI